MDRIVSMVVVFISYKFAKKIEAITGPVGCNRDGASQAAEDYL